MKTYAILAVLFLSSGCHGAIVDSDNDSDDGSGGKGGSGGDDGSSSSSSGGDDGSGPSTGSGQGGNVTNPATTSSGGNDGVMCEVRFEWTPTDWTPTGAGYVFGQYDEPSSPKVAGWLQGYEDPNPGKHSLCTLSESNSKWTCTRDIESGTDVEFTGAFKHPTSDTGWSWFFDTACWVGGGCGSTVGVTKVIVDGHDSGFSCNDPEDFVATRDGIDETNNGLVHIECD